MKKSINVPNPPPTAISSAVPARDTHSLSVENQWWILLICSKCHRQLAHDAINLSYWFYEKEQEKKINDYLNWKVATGGGHDYAQATLAALDELLASQILYILCGNCTARIIGRIEPLLLIRRRFLMHLFVRIIFIARCWDRFLIFNLRAITTIGYFWGWKMFSFFRIIFIIFSLDARIICAICMWWHDGRCDGRRRHCCYRSRSRRIGCLCHLLCRFQCMFFCDFFNFVAVLAWKRNRNVK